MYHRFAATAAETAFAVPLEKLVSGDSRKCQILWFSCTEYAGDLKLIIRQKTGIQIRDQVKMFLVNREEIDIIFIQIPDFSLQLTKAWKSHGLAVFFHKDLTLFIGEDVA